MPHKSENIKTKKPFHTEKATLLTLYFSRNNGDVSILRSKLTPFQRVRQDLRDVQVAVKANGSLVCGWCTCIAGTSATCNHIIAVLYNVDYAVRDGYNNLACASIPCGWNQSTRKDVEPSKIIDLNLRRDKASKAQADSEGLINEAWLNFDPRKECQRDISEQRKKSFLEGLKNKAPDAQIAGKGLLDSWKAKIGEALSISVLFLS